MGADPTGGGGDWAAPGSSTPPPGWSAEQPPPAPSWPPPAGAYPPGGQGWGQPYNSPPPAPRPGIIPLRPLGVGELLDGAFTAMRRYPRATLGLSAMIATVQQLLGFLIDTSAGGYASPTTTGLSAFGTVSGVVSFVISAILSAILLGMLALVISEAVLGREISIEAVWRRLRPQVWRLIGAALLATILPYFGLIGLIIGGVFLWVALSFTTPALVLEQLTVRQALRRSWRLAVPDFWRVLGIRLLALIIAGVIAGVLSIPGIVIAFTSLTDSVENGGAVQLGLVAEIAIRLSSLVASTITTPITAGVLALLYIDRRMRAEALDVALARAAAETPPR